MHQIAVVQPKRALAHLPTVDNELVDLSIAYKIKRADPVDKNQMVSRSKVQSRFEEKKNYQSDRVTRHNGGKFLWNSNCA